MTSAYEKVSADVLRRIIPTPEESECILVLAQELTQKIKKAAENAGLTAEVGIEGSVAKDTWLRDEPELDLFIRVPTTLNRNAFNTICLDVAKKATRGFQQVERFAEHPYLESTIHNVRVNIVPCYAVKQGEWLSATDRTPFHTSYIQKHLSQQEKNEVRLLKKFMQGIGVYGAEIKIGGFSGYLCELLILQYRSFVKVLQSASNWKRKVVIDYQKYFHGKDKEAERTFEGHIIVVDPVDKRRNVAAAVREQRLYEFVAAARVFLKNPNLSFFYPPDIDAFAPEKVAHAITVRGSDLLFVRFGQVRTVSDVLWGQLYKTDKLLAKLLEQFDFKILRNEVWSDDEDINIFIFEVEERIIPPTKKHWGPPVEKRDACERFLRKHLGSDQTVSGPRVEEGRWIVEIKREYIDAVELLFQKLNGGRHIGIPTLLSNVIADSFEVLVNEEILTLYSSHAKFAKFLTKYLTGTPRWLNSYLR